MKKLFKFLTLSFIPLLICSCNAANNSTENSGAELVSSEVYSDNSKEVVSSTSKEEFQVKLNQVYSSSSWDENINKMIEYVLEDKANSVPSFIAPSFEAVVKNQTIQEQKTTVFEIKCFGVNSTSATKLYTEKMVEKGYALSSESNYGYLFMDYAKDAFLTYELVSGEESYFLIQAFVLTNRETSWNKTIVDLYCDMEVPSYEAPAYTTEYNQYYDRLTVYALFVGKNAANDYVATLRTKGYTVSQTDSTGAIQLVDKSGYLTVTVYQTYGDYDCDALYIAFSNAWPALAIVSYTGIMHLPKVNSYTATYDGYTYVDSEGQGREEDYTLCVYFVNASSTDYGNYVTALANLGFTKGQTETNESGIMSTYLTYKTEDYYLITLRVLYKISTSEICLVIYQAYQVE